MIYKMWQYLLYLILISTLTLPAFAKKSPQSLKKQLLTLYQSHPFTFFCHHPFEPNGFTKIHYCKSCPPQHRRIQWMMIVPSHHLARDLLCFREKICRNNKGESSKGIGCCQKSDPHYRKMQQDLHNWVPELSVFIQERGQYPFAVIKDHHPKNSCQLYFDKKQKIVDPPPTVRGFIARTYLYMSQKYHLVFSNEEYQQFWQWHQQYPPSEWEKKRNEKIWEIQGDGNSYIN